MRNQMAIMKKLKQGGSVSAYIGRFGAIIGMALVLIAFQLIDSRFMNPKNIIGVLNTSTFLIIMSLAMMLCMSVRGMDLSVAQVADLTGVLAAILILKQVPFWAAILAALAAGLVIGILNGFIISYLGVPAIIGTMGMMFIVRSVELTITDSAQPQILFTLPQARVRNFFFIGQGAIGPISMLIVLCTIVVVAIYFFKERSVIGRHMDAVQGSGRAAYLSSINIRRVFASAFVGSSVLAAVAGIMLVSRAGTAVPRGVESYLTDCFVAVYIGALLSRSGRFNVIGTVVGALFVGFLSNFFTLMGFGAAIKSLFYGLFIILAVLISALQKRRNVS